jgi:hypothetical protein
LFPIDSNTNRRGKSVMKNPFRMSEKGIPPLPIPTLVPGCIYSDRAAENESLSKLGLDKRSYARLVHRSAAYSLTRTPTRYALPSAHESQTCALRWRAPRPRLIAAYCAARTFSGLSRSRARPFGAAFDSEHFQRPSRLVLGESRGAAQISLPGSTRKSLPPRHQKPM